MWSRLGTEVTVIEFAKEIVLSMDGEVRKSFTRSLKKQGIKFKMQKKVGISNSPHLLSLLSIFSLSSRFSLSLPRSRSYLPSPRAPCHTTWVSLD